MRAKIVDIEWAIICFKNTSKVEELDWITILNRHLVCRTIITQADYSSRQAEVTSLRNTPPTPYTAAHIENWIASIKYFQDYLDSAVIYETLKTSEAILNIEEGALKKVGLRNSFIDFTTEFLNDYSHWSSVFRGHLNRHNQVEANVLVKTLNRYKLDSTKGLKEIELIIDLVINQASIREGWNENGSFARRTTFLKRLLSTLKDIDRLLTPIVIVEAEPEAPRSAFA